MKTHFKFVVYSFVVLTLILLSTLKASSSPENNTLLQFEDWVPTYDHKAWYEIRLGNIPVGVLAVGVQNLKTGFPSSYQAQFISRVGDSPFMSNGIDSKVNFKKRSGTF